MTGADTDLTLGPHPTIKFPAASNTGSSEQDLMQKCYHELKQELSEPTPNAWISHSKMTAIIKHYHSSFTF